MTSGRNGRLDTPGTDPWYLKFHDLMPHRVREILLVSSPYDAFTLEEDGRLTERIFTEYSELNLSSAPRITHVSTGARALELLSERPFDLVLTMVRIVDTDVGAFARQVKSVYPKMPVVLLVLTESDLGRFPGGPGGGPIDHVFWWTGDARILLAVIKTVEDALNAPPDTRNADVRVIIVVEDSIRRYSSMLSIIYAELMTQSSSLVAEGVNDLHRLLRMRARPKVLLARSYEEAVALWRRYREHVVAVVSDVRFPRRGVEDPSAGVDLINEFRAEEPDLPVLLQSAEPDVAARAEALGVQYAEKSSESLLAQVRLFVNENLGFGEFVFRLPDAARTEVARARDMYELEAALRSVPAASVEYHSRCNHFSLWLMARSMFALARSIRPKTIEEFGDIEGLRRYLLDSLADARRRQGEGVVTDFSSRAPNSLFVRLGKGSLGGKARGLAFVNALLARHAIARRREGLDIRIPRSLVVTTDEFDRFLAMNHVLDEGIGVADESEVLRRCLEGSLPDDLARDLRRAHAEMHGPLAVRSSSLLEDSQLQPFAGIYTTFMLPNNHPDPEVRFQELTRAIKAVWASTYSRDALDYIAGTPYSIEEEKMAVLVQEIVGRAHGPRFYPTISGVAVSWNYYPVGHQQAEDGLVMAALGLGHAVVQGGKVLQFSPRTPDILPQFRSAYDYVRYTQTHFRALDLSTHTVDFWRGGEASLRTEELKAAREDGTLDLVGSVYDGGDDVVRDSTTAPGVPIVTLNNVLRYEAFPLAPAIADLLDVFRTGLGTAVELEFAVDDGGWGRPGARTPVLYVLQVRPQGVYIDESGVELGGFSPEQVLVRTDRSLGHGIVDDVRDIIFVHRSDPGPLQTPAIAEQVGRFNSRLHQARTPYLLVGPGRWGSSDPGLGIPVKWTQINGARVIVETDFSHREVEPSQGAHFFHNVTSFRIGYLTLSHVDRRHTAHEREIDQEWLLAQPVAEATADVRHIRLERPLRIIQDGRSGKAVVLKPSSID
jgi:DNA-binding NarL/FixJ family response regulator